MEYDDYIRSTKPVRFSVIALTLTSLLPISLLVSEGWHSGVPWAAFFAVQMAVLMPGIYLIRPRVFWVWMALTITLSITGICTIEYYWLSALDWMDAEIPMWVSHSIKASAMLILGSSIVFGIFGWVKYFIGRRQSHNNNLHPIPNRAGAVREG